MPTKQTNADTPDLAAALEAAHAAETGGAKGGMNVDWGKVAEFVQAVLPVLLRFVK